MLKQKRRPKGRRYQTKTQKELFDFCFLKIHMLFCNWIIFTHRHFFCHCAAVFLGYIVKTGICCAQQFYLNCSSLRHGMYFRYILELPNDTANSAGSLNLVANLVCGAEKSSSSFNCEAKSTIKLLHKVKTQSNTPCLFDRPF